MLAISETSNGYFCFEWFITEDGPKIVNFQHLNIKTDLSDTKSLRNILTALKPTLKNESNSLSLCLSNTNYSLSEFKYDSEFGLKKSVDWYENSFLNTEYSNNHFINYYPLLQNNSFLVLTISKKIKNSLVETANDLGYDLVYLSTDIFSASTGIRQLYKLKKNKGYLVWKLAKNNYHYLIHMKDERICSYLKAKKSGKNIKRIIEIGDKVVLNKMSALLFSTIIENKVNEDFNHIYIYQTKNDKNNLQFINKINKNINIVDFSCIAFENKKNKMTYNQYAENGISFRGLDV